MTTYLIKLGELTLKNGNRKEFENQLVRNARTLLKGTNAVVTMRYGRFYAECTEKDEQHVEWMLDHLSGITGWAKCTVCNKDMESIQKAVIAEALRVAATGAKTFKIETRRADKQFPFNSYQISEDMGAAVLENTNLTVQIKKPDAVINVEVREKSTYVYSAQTKAHRGLPSGTGGRGILMLSGGIDSPVAGYRIMKRGMHCDCLYFHSYPYTSDEAKQKVIDLAKKIAPFGMGTHLNIIPFTDVQRQIKMKAPEAFSTLMLRICMMKTANMMAKYTGAKCIITGESLGQVASQTIENLTVTHSYAKYPILQPLIGLDKEEIVETALRIGTYDISILPYEDCCVLFSPKHPTLRTDLAEAQRIFDAMEIDSLIEEAFANRDFIKIPAVPEEMLQSI